MELSDLLRRLPLHPMRRYRSSFRNPTGVAMKLGNFLSLDPDYEGVGLSSTSQLDKEVWAEFEGDEERLRTTAEAIRRNYHRLDPDLDLAEVEEDDEAPEGRILMRLHKKRERSRSLVHKKKQQVHDATGQLACEICGFDFEATYGVLGKGFAECHHTTPVATLEPGHRTHVSDLAIVCANCHRMLHRESGGLGLEDLRTRLVARS